MRLKIWAAMITIYIVWGSTYLAIHFAVESMPPFLMAAVRFLIAGSILFFWRWASGDRLPTRLEWRSAAIVGGLLLVGGNGGVVWAEQRLASGIAALLVGSAPLWMVLIDAFSPLAALRTHSKDRRPSWRTILGVVLGFAGIALLVGPAHGLGSRPDLDPLGVAALLLAALLWATGSLYSREARLPASPLLGSGMEMLAGGAGLLLLGSLSGEWSRLNLSMISAASLLGLLYLIVFGSLAGYVSYTWLLRNAPTPLVSTYAYVNPLIAIFIGNWLAKEPLTPRILFSALIIVSAVALINTAAAPRRSLQMASLPSTGDD